MNKKLLANLVAALFACDGVRPIERGRAYTSDAAFAFRMGAGFPGDITRTHPVSIEPVDQSNTPVANYGFPCVIAADGTNGVRQLTAADNALTTIYGVVVRPFPQQQATSAGNFGGQGFNQAVAPSSQGPLDVMRLGYILVQLPTDSPQVAKGGPVFIWTAASAGTHVIGGFEGVTPAGNGFALAPTRYMYNGPQDANSVAELVVTS